MKDSVVKIHFSSVPPKELMNYDFKKMILKYDHLMFCYVVLICLENLDFCKHVNDTKYVLHSKILSNFFK